MAEQATLEGPVQPQKRVGLNSFVGYPVITGSHLL